MWGVRGGGMSFNYSVNQTADWSLSHSSVNRVPGEAQHHLNTKVPLPSPSYIFERTSVMMVNVIDHGNCDRPGRRGG